MWLLLAVLGCSEPAAEVAPEPVTPVQITVLAAASLTDVLPLVAADWTADTTHTTTFTFDSTSRLAKQVEAGAPADVFFSADTEWIAWLDERELIEPATRVDLLGNDLVLVVPSDSTFAPASAADLAKVERLGLAGESVPAGKYGKASLEALGAWNPAQVVAGDSVRTVLGWVASGEVEAGIVYATDARVEPKVRVAFAFPDDSHPPIVYPAAVTSASAHPAEAAAFVAFCKTSPRFEVAGFEVLVP